MAPQQPKVEKPSTHQPSKAELEEDVRIDAPAEALAWAVTRGGATRRDRALTPGTPDQHTATHQS